MLPYI